jgi:mannose-6-phosphate isomerase
MEQKKKVFEQAAKMLEQLQFDVTRMDDSRPWGGFFVIDETQGRAVCGALFSR